MQCLVNSFFHCLRKAGSLCKSFFSTVSASQPRIISVVCYIFERMSELLISPCLLRKYQEPELLMPAPVHLWDHLFFANVVASGVAWSNMRLEPSSVKLYAFQKLFSGLMTFRSLCKKSVFLVRAMEMESYKGCYFRLWFFYFQDIYNVLFLNWE